MGVGTGAGGAKALLDYEFFTKKGCFLSFEWEKNNFTTFYLLWKKSFRRPWLRLFVFKQRLQNCFNLHGDGLAYISKEAFSSFITMLFGKSVKRALARPLEIGRKNLNFLENLTCSSSISIDWFISCNDTLFTAMKLTLQKSQVHCSGVTTLKTLKVGDTGTQGWQHIKVRQQQVGIALTSLFSHLISLHSLWINYKLYPFESYTLYPFEKMLVSWYPELGQSCLYGDPWNHKQQPRRFKTLNLFYISSI